MKVLLVFAHPDDESFAVGGTVAKLVKKGVRVVLISATKGEAGSVGNPSLCKQEELGKFRERELRCAAKILGISKIYFLGFVDGTLKNVPNNKISKKILPILKEEKPDIVITFDKFGGSNHPDHIAVSRAATKSYTDYRESVKKRVRLYYVTNPRSLVKKYAKMGFSYTAFGKIKGTPDGEITTEIDVSETFQIKVRALKCHQTQKKDWERFISRTNESSVKKEFFKLVFENSLI